MVYLYVTTDEGEAEALIEDTEVNEEPKHIYHEFGLTEGEGLIKRIGFDPMTSVEMNGNVSEKELDEIATMLVKEGLYVATETDERVRRYIPHDVETREEMVKLAMQKERKGGFVIQPADYLLRYSNGPNEIREFYSF